MLFCSCIFQKLTKILCLTALVQGLSPPPPPPPPRTIFEKPNFQNVQKSWEYRTSMDIYNSSFLAKPVNKNGMYHISAYHLFTLGSLGYK